MNPGYSLTTTIEPTAEPVSAELIRQQCRVADTADNSDLYAMWGIAARKMIEAETQVRLITQTIKLSMPYFPNDGYIKIPIEPVASITSLTYYDVAGSQQTLVAGTDYLTELARRPPVVYQHPLGYFPPTQTACS